jgi:hypothetical protein
MDVAAAFEWFLTAFLAMIVFAGVFAALYVAAISLPVRGPGWLAWPLLALMLSASSFAAYTIVVEPALDDDDVECSEDVRDSAGACLNQSLTGVTPVPDVSR